MAHILGGGHCLKLLSHFLVPWICMLCLWDLPALGSSCSGIYLQELAEAAKLRHELQEQQKRAALEQASHATRYHPRPCDLAMCSSTCEAVRVRQYG